MSTGLLSIYQHLLSKIMDGVIRVDGKLPTEVELASRFDTNRMVASAVVKNLEEHGLVFRKKRHGTILVRKPTLLEARDLIQPHINRIHVLGVLGGDRITSGMHWNNMTLSSLEKVLNESNYNLVYHDMAQVKTRREFDRFLAENLGLDSYALIFMPANQVESAFLLDNYDVVFRYHQNVYMLDNGTLPMGNWPFHRLCLDPFYEGTKAAEYISKFRGRRFAFVTTRSESHYYVRERQRGVDIGLTRTEDASKKFEVWNDVEVDKIKAGSYLLVAPTTKAAQEILIRLEREGLKPPKDFGILGFDDNPALRSYNITNIAPPMDRIGSLLGEMILFQGMDHDKGSQIVVKVEPRVIERETCRLD